MRAVKAKALRRMAKLTGHSNESAYYEGHNSTGSIILHRGSWRSIYRKLKRGRPLA